MAGTIYTVDDYGSSQLHAEYPREDAALPTGRLIQRIEMDKPGNEGWATVTSILGPDTVDQPNETPDGEMIHVTERVWIKIRKAGV